MNKMSNEIEEKLKYLRENYHKDIEYLSKNGINSSILVWKLRIDEDVELSFQTDDKNIDPYGINLYFNSDKHIDPYGINLYFNSDKHIKNIMETLKGKE
jgi:hypothetical protein